MCYVNKLDMTLQKTLRTSTRSSFMTKEEANLLARAHAGDAAAFESLVMPHRATMLRIVQRILRNREDAEDVVQTAFLSALRHLAAFQGNSRFSSWLTRIAINAAFMRLRVSRRSHETSIDEMVEGEDTHRRMHLVEARPNPEQECAAKEARGLLDKAFNRLGPLYTQVLHLRVVEELSVNEAAQILELPVGTVKARLYRARTALTRHVQLMATSRRAPIVASPRRSSAFM
jgi:RNA polymerase sigma-70 factor, ECF subfamily